MSEYIYNLNTVGISSNFIENIMPKANGAFVKVYLYAINAAAHGKSFECDEIASALDLLESDVVKAFEYLSENNCIKIDGEKIIFIDPVPQAQEQPKQIFDSHSKYENQNVDDIFNQNETLSELLEIAQSILGKPLSRSDCETLYWFYDNLMLSPEVISMLLEYCVSINKRNMNYIEKVAISWSENGITTVEAASKYMAEQKEKNTFVGNMKKLLGIESRNFSKTEETYLKTWTEQYSMNEDMIALAYEYCIINTGKLSFPYMNSIMENWHSNDIHTVTDAENQNAERKKNKDLNVYKDDTDYDYDKIEEIMQQKYDN